MERKSRTVKDTLAKFFGDDWIEEQLSKVELEGYNDMSPMNLARIDWHPIVRAIVGTQIKLRRSERAGSDVALGNDELQQQLLHGNLTVLEPYLDIDDTKNRLRDKVGFPKLEYELAIAAGYVRAGYKVNFIPREQAKRTGEFYVQNKEETEVLVECKKKDMITSKEMALNHWWEEFQHLLVKEMKKKKLFSYGVLVNIPEDPDRSETKEIVKAISQYCNSGLMGRLELKDHKYKLDIQRLNSREKVESFYPDSSLGSDRMLSNLKTGQVTEVIVVRGKYPSDYMEEKIKSIIKTLGQAYGQLDEHKPNIVYIDINVASMTPERSDFLMNALPDAIKKVLYKDYSKISAVVVTDVKLLKHSNLMGFRADERVILNQKAKNPLPDDFKLYGDKEKGFSVLLDLKKLLYDGR